MAATDIVDARFRRSEGLRQAVAGRNVESDLPFCHRQDCAPGDAMDDDATPMDRANEYRNTADMMRLLAQQMLFAESRDRLLTLADSFDKLADRVVERETREPMAANAAD